MAAQLPVLRIFIASPGDVAAERRLVADIIENDLAKRAAFENRVVLRAVRWDDPDRHIPMVLGKPPQESVTDALPRPALCDIVVVLLWARMGTPLQGNFRKPDGSPYLSGTEWELLDALGAAPRPDILLFWREGQPPLAETDEAAAEQLRQRGLVKALVQKVQADGHVNRYASVEALRDSLTDQLEALVVRRLAELGASVVMREAPVTFQTAEPAWQFVKMKGERGANGEAFRIEANPAYRGDVAARLVSEHVGQRYRRMLDGLLASAERIWGPRGSSQAFVTCVFISLLYSYLLFWLSILSGADNPFAEATLLSGSSTDTTSRWLAFALAVVLPAIMWPLGRWIGYTEKRFVTRRRRSLMVGKRKAWSRRYRLISAMVAPVLILAMAGPFWVSASVDFAVAAGVVGLFSILAMGPVLGVHWGGRLRRPWSAMLIGAVAVAVAGAVAGAVAVAVAVAGAVAVALAGAVAGAVAGAGAALSVRAGVRRVNLLSAMLGGILSWAVLGLILFGNNSLGIFFVLSFMLLPVANGALDFVSWWVSRLLGGLLQMDLSDAVGTFKRLRNALLHIVVDAALAVIFFLAMAATLGFAFELYGQYGSIGGVELLRQGEDGTSGYAVDVLRDPFGTGLWITLMLATTLVPTLVHLAAVIGAGLPAVLLPDGRRAGLAMRLDALPIEPPEDEMGRREWRETIWQAARFGASYRWRLVAGLVVTGILMVPPIMLGLRVRLGDWAFDSGVLGIEAARWVWGG